MAIVRAYISTMNLPDDLRDYKADAFPTLADDLLALASFAAFILILVFWPTA